MIPLEGVSAVADATQELQILIEIKDPGIA